MSSATPEPAAPRRGALETLPGQLALAAVLASVVVASATLWRGRAAPAQAAEAPLDDGKRERPFGQLELERVLMLLRPAELGVVPWQPGQFARYAFRSTFEATRDGSPAQREVRASVLRPSDPDDVYPARFGVPYPDMHWLRLEALRAFRGIPSDVYHLASPQDLSIGPPSPASAYMDGYIPFVSNESDPISARGALFRAAGLETIDVAGLTLACRRYEVVLGPEAPGEPDETVATLWHHPDVAPLGIVRLHSPRESLELLEFGVAAPSYPMGIAPLVEGISVFAEMCHSCHGETCHEPRFPPH